MKLFVTLLTVLSLYAATAPADSIHTIELRHRPSEDLIPLILPLLDPDESITGRGQQLFIRASNQKVEEIRQIITKLDTAPRILLISVFQGDDRDLRALSIEQNFKFEHNRTDVGIDKQTGSSYSGSNVGFSTRNPSGGRSDTIYSSRGRLSDNPIHQLRITEGTQGYIETGESLPYFSGDYWRDGRDRRGRGKKRGGGYGDYEGGVEYKDIYTGFYVYPRIQGQQVTLDVSPYKERESDERAGDYKMSSAHTRITGPLGKWLPIGGTTEETQSRNTGIGISNSTRSRDNKSIWIKADLVQ